MLGIRLITQSYSNSQWGELEFLCCGFQYTCTSPIWISLSLQFFCACVCVCVCSCGYSQCGLPWFQGEVSPIPPISGASLRDILGSLMLSIVGGIKPLPVFLTSPLSSFSFLPVTPEHFLSFTSAQRYLGLHRLMDCSLLPYCLGCGPLRHVLWGTSGNASSHSLCFVTIERNKRVMNNKECVTSSFFFFF